MKRKVLLFLAFNLAFIALGLTANNYMAQKNVVETTDVWEDRLKNDWIEGLMEFADEDDTLDSLDYVPDFLR